MTDTEKYEMIGKLIESPTQHDMVRAVFVCSAPSGSVRRIKDGAQIEDLAQSMGGGSIMEISPERVEDIEMTVAEFCKFLIGLVEAGGMESYWPGKIRVNFHIRGWADIPIK
jgi:hypothetical protein